MAQPLIKEDQLDIDQLANNTTLINAFGGDGSFSTVSPPEVISTSIGTLWTTVSTSVPSGTTTVILSGITPSAYDSGAQDTVGASWEFRKDASSTITGTARLLNGYYQVILDVTAAGTFQARLNPYGLTATGGGTITIIGYFG